MLFVVVVLDVFSDFVVGVIDDVVVSLLWVG